MNSPKPSTAPASLPGSVIHGGRMSAEILSTFLRAAVLSGHIDGVPFPTNGNDGAEVVDERKMS